MPRALRTQAWAQEGLPSTWEYLCRLEQADVGWIWREERVLGEQPRRGELGEGHPAALSPLLGVAGQARGMAWETLGQGQGFFLNGKGEP